MKKFLIILFLMSFCIEAQEKFNVYFDFDKDTPNSDATLKLQSWMKEQKNVEVYKVEAFCDSVDTNFYNKNLATRRMHSVLDILKTNQFAISPNLEATAVGEDFKQSKIQAENRKVTFFYKPITIKKSNIENTKDVEEEPVEEALKVSLLDLFKNAKEGDLIKIQNINFYFNSEVVVPKSESVLNELYQIMESHPNLKIEIQGHICCNPNPNDTKLSFRRALYIFNYLRKKGIDLCRLGYRGFGSSRPIYSIPEKNYQEKQANRRVEILIIKND